MSYAFLSQPPAQKLPAPSIPSSPVKSATRRRSATTSAISAWAAQIVPGSPIPPTPRTPSKSPHSPLGFGFGARRSSYSSALRSPGSFLNLLDTPSVIYTPSPKALEHKPAAELGLDFLAQGYTTVIVQLPALSPLAPRTAPASDAHKTHLPPPTPESPTRLKAKKSFTRLRSLSFKSAKKMLSTKATPTSQSSSSRPSKVKSHKSSTPHSRYAHLIAPGGGSGALPLSQEIQLSQMLDGGSLDANVRRVVERHARDTGAMPSERSKARDSSSRKDRRAIESRDPLEQVGGGVSGVYRDGRGGMWWDEDERLELVELLPETLSASAPPPKKTLGILPRLKTKPAREELRPDWVDPSAPTSPVSPGTDVLRRGSATSSGSRDSDLDPSNTVRPRDSIAVGGGNFVAGYSLGMHRTQAGYAPGVLDAFAVSPLDVSARDMGNNARPRPRARHRPAPLTLSPPELPLPAVPVPPTATPSYRHEKARRTAAAPPPLPAVTVPLASEGRRDFFASSFAPAPTTTTPTSASSSKENSGAPKSARRGSVTFGLSSGFSTFANSVTPKSARRASTASPVSPRTFVPPPPAGSSVHLPLAPREKERSLKHKASRSKLTSLFRSRS